jgi:hypothetical protein
MLQASDRVDQQSRNDNDAEKRSEARRLNKPISAELAMADGRLNFKRF